MNKLIKIFLLLIACLFAYPKITLADVKSYDFKNSASIGILNSFFGKPRPLPYPSGTKWPYVISPTIVNETRPGWFNGPQNLNVSDLQQINTQDYKIINQKQGGVVGELYLYLKSASNKNAAVTMELLREVSPGTLKVFAREQREIYPTFNYYKFTLSKKPYFKLNETLVLRISYQSSGLYAGLAENGVISHLFKLQTPENLIIGDSISVGGGDVNSDGIKGSVEDIYAAFPNKLNLSGVIGVNGFPGGTLRDVALTDAIGEAQYAGAKKVFLEFGNNDSKLYMNLILGEFENLLQEQITKAKALGLTIYIISPIKGNAQPGVYDPEIVYKYWQSAKTVCDEMAVSFIDVYTEMNPVTMIQPSQSEYLHPNNLGHQFIADKINQAVF